MWLHNPGPPSSRQLLMTLTAEPPCLFLLSFSDPNQNLTLAYSDNLGNFTLSFWTLNSIINSLHTEILANFHGFTLTTFLPLTQNHGFCSHYFLHTQKKINLSFLFACFVFFPLFCFKFAFVLYCFSSHILTKLSSSFSLSLILTSLIYES